MTTAKINCSTTIFYQRHRAWFGEKELQADILQISRGSYKKRGGYEDGIRGKGYVVPTLEAALWAFWSTKTFEAGALAAVNLGDDADTDSGDLWSTSRCILWCEQTAKALVGACLCP